ncbi:IclR family transcriptional regulator [Pseudoruegeria sp. SHC-113]|uniref:IclR family transcriptional regulator n=1 Tax=Pseudoruegeria sp. SHC-113 TaxID=2855439 RepID=UPI0021BB6229|nr:IclR family transcriptional regulator [Pseudoruegeria sp. SHC-113]MCT8161628.1 IclR family transcriptional regulator [Pseudoruegeria sp. SHC-113]
MPEDATSPDAKGQVPPNVRLLLLLEEVARQGTPVAPAALAEALDLPKATMHRLLATAEEQGFLQRDADGRSFGPGHRMRKLASNTLSSQRIRTERLFIMRHLATTVGETCNLAAPGRSGMVYLDRVETHWPLRIQLPIGTQVPFHCTASGKMYLSSLRSDKLARLLKWLDLQAHTEHSIQDEARLLADLAAISKRGYATDDQEFMAGMVAVAVPIRDDEGRLLTTLSIHAPTQRHSVASLVDNLAPLQDAAEQMARLI